MWSEYQQKVPETAILELARVKNPLRDNLGKCRNIVKKHVIALGKKNYILHVYLRFRVEKNPLSRMKTSKDWKSR